MRDNRHGEPGERDSEERTMRSEGELTRHLPPEKRHAYPDPDAVWRFIEAAKPDLMAAASMEKYRDCWRLRITLNRPAGGVVHRSVVISGDGTAGV
jgi:hypothetical protein